MAVIWQPRLAVLTSDKLIFSKFYEEACRDAHKLPPLDITHNQLWHTFEQHDTDKNGFVRGGWGGRAHSARGAMH